MLTWLIKPTLLAVNLSQQITFAGLTSSNLAFYKVLKSTFNYAFCNSSVAMMDYKTVITISCLYCKW